MMTASLPTVIFAEEAVVFSFVSDKPSEDKVRLGDTVTYTVRLTENSGFSFGTLFFHPSDNLTCVSATLMGEEAAAVPAETGENAGSYGIIIMGDMITETYDSFCTITFKVTNKGDISVRLYGYQLTDGKKFITPLVENETVTHTAETLSAPTVTTSALPDAIMGYEYSFKLEGSDGEFVTWSVEGTLPSGITFSPEGILSGTPTEFGEFPLVFKSTLLGELASEGKSLTLNVLEKPRKLELEETSIYRIDGEYLKKVVERTALSDFINSFKNKENIKVFDANGAEITSDSALIGTGYTVSLMHGDEKVHTVTVVVLGDVNGNGRVDVADYQRVKMCLFGKSELSDAYFQAALIAERPNITVSDYQRIKMHIFGNFDIYKKGE